MLKKILRPVFNDGVEKKSQDKERWELRRVNKSFNQCFYEVKDEIFIFKKKLVWSELISLLQNFTAVKSVHLYVGTTHAGSIKNRIHQFLFKNSTEAVDSVNEISLIANSFYDFIYNKLRIVNPVNQFTLQNLTKFFPKIESLNLSDQIKLEDRVFINYIKK